MVTPRSIEAADPVPAMGGARAAATDAWAGSGAMWLTGEPGRPSVAAPARLALAMEHWGRLVADRSSRAGREVRIDAPALLGERAALARLERHGSISVGEGCRMLECADGWLALSLTRDDDWDLLPAWLGGEVAGDWEAVCAAVSHRDAGALVDLGAALGLACARVGEVDARSQPLVRSVDVHRRPAGPSSLIGARVVDLSSLWAGPLCANLLGSAGARVVKVESSSRPDGARRGPAAFYDLMHAGHESVVLDFGDDDGRRSLQQLLAGADIVIEASRPRALEQLGVSHRDLRGAGWDGIWLAITAYGTSADAAMRIGYGDDAAAAGGLVVQRHGGPPLFCADAVADPATGLLGAAVVMGLVADGEVGRVEVSLAGTAAHVAAGIDRYGPVSASPDRSVAPPRARPATGRAHRFGADTDQVLASW